MKDCFCGCGRRVPRFPLGIRSINRRGAQVIARLEEIERRGGREHEELAGWFAEGEDIATSLAAAVHGELDPRSLDEQAVREWQAEGRSIAPSRAQATAELGRAVRESGLSSDEAATALGRAMREQGMTAQEAIEALRRGELR